MMAGPGKTIATLILAMTFAACARGPGAGQSPVVVDVPSHTDIWVVELLDSARRLRVGTPVNLTDRAGYDNQPHFLPDGSGFLYTSIGDDGQADIRIFDLTRNRSRRLTVTPEAEFSPTPLVEGDFAVIRVELDGRQRLWRFSADGRQASLMLEAPEPVGYMAWAGPHHIGLFVLGEPPTLVIVDIRSGEIKEVLRSVGRSLQPVPGQDAISVVHKIAEDDWRIVTIGLDGGGPRDIAEALSPAEDFAWTPDGQLIMARGAKLFITRPGEHQAWQELANFTNAGITQITRIAVSPRNDRIAFVVQR